MRAILLQLSIYMLLISSVHLALLDRTELQEYRTNMSQNAFMPHDASLSGMGSSGDLVAPKLSRDGRLENRGHLLLFIVHHERLAADVQYWNHVIESASTQNQMHTPIQYWGVCDAGAWCDSQSREARFTLVGYLDPYEMRVVAKANRNGQVLLYDSSLTLQAGVPEASDPSIESALVLQKAR